MYNVTFKQFQKEQEWQFCKEQKCRFFVSEIVRQKGREYRKLL